jgi:hypothetical protein
MGNLEGVIKLKVTLRHSSGVTKRVKVGFSWTFFFFGLWVVLFRGDFKNFFRIWGLGIITLGIYYIISCWTYNKRYTEDLLVKGFSPVDDLAKNVLISRGLITSTSL